MASDDHDPIVVSTATACVHQSDLETLGKDEWVGDNILAFHAEWLDDLGTRLDEASSAPSVKMMPPSVVELLCALDEEASNQASSVVPTPSERFLLLPVSDRYSSSSPGHSAGGSHWSLLFIDAHKGDSFHLDSLGDINRTAADTVQESIRSLIQAKSGGTLRPAKPRNVECLQQQANGSDCGIYVLFLSSLLHRRLSHDSPSDRLEALIEGVCESSTPDTVMKFRHKYLSWLQTWGEVTHHEEHVQPDQRIRARFLELFSGLGVE